MCVREWQINPTHYYFVCNKFYIEQQTFLDLLLHLIFAFFIHLHFSFSTSSIFHVPSLWSPLSHSFHADDFLLFGSHITLHAPRPTRSNLTCAHVGYKKFPNWKKSVLSLSLREVVLTVCFGCCWEHRVPRPSTASWGWELGDHRRCMSESGCCHSGTDWTALPLLSHGSVGALGKRRCI